MSDPKKETLRRYFQVGHDALLWKLDGLDEYDVRRPLTPTGTNLLGLVKHMAAMELGYLGEVFGEHGIPQPWFGPDAEPNADMWATSEESRADIEAMYQAAWEVSDATISDLELDSPGRVPWWGDQGDVTLHQILIHVIAEVNRHAGHADIIREQLDGAAGHRPSATNLPEEDAQWWGAYRDRLEQVAREVSGTS